MVLKTALTYGMSVKVSYIIGHFESQELPDKNLCSYFLYAEIWLSSLWWGQLFKPVVSVGLI